LSRLLLLLGTETYRAPDFLAAARKLGVDLVVGTDAPGGAAALSPAQTLVLPFEHVERATDAILARHRSQPFAAVVAVDDVGLVLAAKAGERLGLPGNPAESAAAAANKAVFRDILQAAGLSGPWFRTVPLSADPEPIAHEVAYPCVLKPLCLSASRGVIRADTPAQFVAAFRRIARILAEPDVRQRYGALADQLLVEGFIPGAEVALEGMLVDGTLRVLALFDKPDPLDGPFFEETLYVTPSRHPPEVQTAVAEAVGAAVRALGLRTGAVHAEVRLQPNPQGAAVGVSGGVTPILVEVAPRSIGGHCSRSLVFGAGLSLEELILRQALGLAPGSADREGQASGVMMLPIPRAGVLHRVTGQAAALAVLGIVSLEIGIPQGQPVVPLPEGHRYLGFLFAKGSTPADVESALRQAHACLTFEIGGE
jgi:biotin carboxylase